MLKRAFFALSCLFVFSVVAAAETFTIDQTNSKLVFEVQKGQNIKVTGHFKSFSGQFVFDPNNIMNASAQANIQTASLTTKDSEQGSILSNFRDKHLRSDEFFNCDNYPVMSFVSHGATGGEFPRKFTLIGDLKIKDRVKTVNLDVSQAELTEDPATHKIHAHFIAQTVVDRRDFGMNWNQIVAGIEMVHNEVTIKLDIQADAQKGQ
jgi:polyisoprenoid-binding protein YceI